MTSRRSRGTAPGSPSCRTATTAAETPTASPRSSSTTPPARRRPRPPSPDLRETLGQGSRRTAARSRSSQTTTLAAETPTATSRSSCTTPPARRRPRSPMLVRTYGAPTRRSRGASTRIAFVSEANIGGGNPDGNSEVFLYDMTVPSTTQVTSTIEQSDHEWESNNIPEISADGTRIAFSSSENIDGGNPDLNSEVFLYDTTGPSMTQLTSSVGDEGSWGGDISERHADRHYLGPQYRRRKPSTATSRSSCMTPPARRRPRSPTPLAEQRCAVDIGRRHQDRLPVQSQHRRHEPRWHLEIFVHDTTGPSTTQITDTPHEANHPKIPIHIRGRHPDRLLLQGQHRRRKP